MSRPHRIRVLSSVVVSLLATHQPAQAADKTWIGGDSDWSIAGNWDPSGVPVNGDNAFVLTSLPAGINVDFGATSYSSPGLASFVLDGTSGAAQLTQNNAASSLVFGVGTVGLSGNGAIVQSAGTSSGQTLILAALNPSTGTYTMSGGTLSLSGPGQLFVGDLGNGTFIQSNGTVSVAQQVIVGRSAAGAGTYNLSGGTLSTPTLVVGSFNSGTFIQTGGRSLVSGALNIGSISSMYDLQAGTLSAGSINLPVNSTFKYAAPANIAFTTFNQSGGTFSAVSSFTLPANSTYNLNDGTLRTVTDLAVGSSTSPNSALAQSGGRVDVTGDFQVGLNGAGSVLQTGGTVNANGADSLRIGVLSSGNGTYTLNGGVLNATGLSFAGGLRVGEDGNGRLLMGGGQLNVTRTAQVGINNGAVGTVAHSAGNVVIGTPALAGALFIGRNAGANGSYSLSGTGSLTVNGSMQVGFSGNGTFTQTGGETHLVSNPGVNGLFFIANAPGSTGNVSVSGGTLIADYGIFVGGDASSPGGNGTLTIDGTGYVSTSATLVIHQNGVVNLDGGVLDNGLGPDDNILNNGQLNNNGGQLILGGRIFSTTGLSLHGSGGIITQSGGSLSISDRTTIDSGIMQITGGNAVAGGTFIIGRTAGSDGNFEVSGGSLEVDGVLGVGNNGTLGAGNATASGHVSVTAGTLAAQTVVLGNSTGGTGEMTVSGTGNVIVGGGLTSNTLNVNGGSVTVLDQDPPAGEDPVLDRSIVGGYLRDGTINVTGGTVTSPRIKLGITSGHTGTYTQTGGTVDVGIFGAGNDGTMTSGAGVGSVHISGGELNVDTVLLGSTLGGEGQMTVSGTGSVNVGGGMWVRSLTMNGGALTVLDQAPPPGEDPVLDRSIVGGYLRDGSMNVTGGTVTSPRIKLGITSGQTGTYTQTAGTVNAGTVLLGSSAGGIGSLSISGGELRVDDFVIATLSGSFAISGTGQMNLTDAAAVIDYTGSSPLATVKSNITSGYANGSWNGNGINSTTAAATPGYALGYAEASSIFTTIPGIFLGQGVDDTSVLVRYTRYGDADLSGSVNLNDFNRLAANFGAGNTDWAQGNFNFDNVTNLNDFNLLAGNFGLSASPEGPTPADWSALAAAVPEPCAGGLLFASCALLRRRRSVSNKQMNWK